MSILNLLEFSAGGRCQVTYLCESRRAGKLPPVASYILSEHGGNLGILWPMRDEHVLGEGDVKRQELLTVFARRPVLQLEQAFFSLIS